MWLHYALCVIIEAQNVHINALYISIDRSYVCMLQSIWGLS